MLLAISHVFSPLPGTLRSPFALMTKTHKLQPTPIRLPFRPLPSCSLDRRFRPSTNIQLGSAGEDHEYHQLQPFHCSISPSRCSKPPPPGKPFVTQATRHGGDVGQENAAAAPPFSPITPWQPTSSTSHPPQPPHSRHRPLPPPHMP